MRKCFVAQSGGDRESYWDSFIGRSDPKSVFNFAYNKYIPKFDRFIPGGARILEGGCWIPRCRNCMGISMGKQ